MSKDPLQEERRYLAKLLEAIQRCTYFLHESDQKLSWPLSGKYLARHKKDVDLFETLAAVNERFAKLQDTLLGGGTKQRQSADIKLAQSRWNAYRRRKTED